MKAKYHDECAHGRDGFFRTVKLWDMEGDLYFYRTKQGEEPCWSYCFRYGDLGNYKSGPMADQLLSHGYSNSFSAEEIEACSNDRLRLIAYCLEFRGFTL